MEEKTVRIGEAAAILGVTGQTLRNWEKSGRLRAQRTAGGQRYYVREELIRLAVDLPKLAWVWASSAQPPELPPDYYCDRPDRFTSRLEKMGKVLQVFPGTDREARASLLTSVAGEIGDNSFAHNAGNWPDVVGIFFAYDLQKRMIVLADRGQGVRVTLQRVRPAIASDTEALNIAFTETISGRSPEKRGNGLKLVKAIAEDHQIGLTYNSGIALVVIAPHGKMSVSSVEQNVRGVVAVITF